MRAPVPSEPNYYTFPTYQVPQVSAMRGSAPPVQVARTARAVGAEPPSLSSSCVRANASSSVINGSSCPSGNSNLRMQSVTDNCLLNSVTVPKIQRNVAHNNNYNNTSDRLACKSGALLLLGQDIPSNQKADKILPELITTQYIDHDDTDITNNTSITTTTTASTTNNSNNNNISKMKREITAATAAAAYQYYPFEKLVEWNKRTREMERQGFALPTLKLLGGGESSINTGTSGWGTPPSQQASNNNANTSSGWGTANPTNQNNTGTQQWNNNARPPTSAPGNANQDVTKTTSNLASNGQQSATSQSGAGWGPKQQQPTGSNGPPMQAANQPPIAANPQQVQPSTPSSAANSSTKQQLEQLTNMREAIYSQDGWGGQYVNQDTTWDIPDSPEPAMKMDGSGGNAPAWKPNVNNGTDLWEANLRNGGQPPPQPQQKTPWGHTPSTNIGGTWGEDDDAADSSNVWTGVPSGQQPQQPPQWGAGNAAAGGNAAASTGTGMWGGKKDNEWGAGGSAGGSVAGGGTPSGWGDPRVGDPRAPPMDPREMCPDPRDLRAGSSDPMRIVDPQQMRILGGDMRGDPRGGITGRLNGSNSEFWGQGGGGPQSGAHHMHHQGKMPVGPGGNGSAGWEELSPPSQRRNMPSYDNGTSLWGNPQPGGSHWKDLPTGGGGGGGAMTGRGSVSGPPGMAPNPRQGMKPPAGDGNSAWRNGGSSWGGPCDEPGAAAGWSEDASPWNKQKCMTGAPIWPDNDMDWSHKQGPKPPITKEAIWSSKQFRMLVEMGYKKDDVENALRLREMNAEEALEMLSARLGNMDWRGGGGRGDDHYDGPPFAGQRFPSGPAPLNFPPELQGNNMSNLGGSLINANPALVQKILSQSGTPGLGSGNTAGGSAGNAGRSLPMQTHPSTTQLRLLVQQIQMAVQAGYLNHQILNQPLAPQTLVLLNQLLQQIKNLQSLTSQQQQFAQNQGLGKSNNAVLQYSVFITKTKQSIINLQNQIASQQANYVKHHAPSDLFKANPVPDSINALQCNISEMSIKDNQSSQSRFIRDWKLPNNKEENSDFIRTVGKPVAPSHNSPNLNPLGLPQSAGPWSSGRSADTGWPESGSVETPSDIKDAQWAVPEFEPGKPWKGTQKTIEDDPSITPGSVGRSPLSLSTIKDSDIFNQPSKSPPVSENSIQSISLSSSTWSYPTSSSSTAFASPQNKVPSNKSVLGALTPTTAANSDLWSAPKRGPPPGLSNKGGGNSSVNGWSSNIGGSSGWGVSRNNWPGTGSGSQWLLLRNLTAQIDGSTLRTLCMQHGPLDCFHLYLHNGYALAKYQSNEEAAKAKNALNNCVLSNTSILAENPSDWEATNLVQQVSNQPGGSGGGWRGSGANAPPPQPQPPQPQQQPQPPNASDNTWSTGWPNTSSTSLWGSSSLETAEQSRGTPSNLQPFLPPDLLGGESI